MQSVNTEAAIKNAANVQMFKYGDVELPVKTYADGSIEFDAEQSAFGLGLTKFNSQGKEYVRWERVNEYIGVSTTGHKIKRGDFITEPQFYKLAIKANNQVAEKFQNWVTSEVLPALRKTGTYSVTTTCQYPVSAAIESATNAGRLFERIMKSEGIPPHEIAMAVRDIFLQAGINVPDYVIRIPAYEQLAMTFGKSGEVACS